MSAASTAARTTGNPGVNNTAWLFFVLAMAFLFFVTVRGDLPKWLGLLGLGGSPTGAATAAGAPTLGGGLPALPAIPAIGSAAPAMPQIPGGGVFTDQTSHF